MNGALLKFAEGPRLDASVRAMGRLTDMADWIFRQTDFKTITAADLREMERRAVAKIRRRSNSYITSDTAGGSDSGSGSGNGNTGDKNNNNNNKNNKNNDNNNDNKNNNFQSRNPWWPILLGLSKLCGDGRKPVRIYALNTLTALIETYFFQNDAPVGHRKEVLRLLFRATIIPVFEFGKDDATSQVVERLPEGFMFYSTPNASTSTPMKAKTKKKSGGSGGQNNKNNNFNGDGDDSYDSNNDVTSSTDRGWLSNTFEPTLATCVSLCVKCKNCFDDYVLIDEIFAILNGCISQDENGALAIYSLKRLDKFITVDCGGKLTESMWDSVGNIFLRCLRNVEADGGKNAFLLAEVIEKIGVLLIDNFENSIKDKNDSSSSVVDGGKGVNGGPSPSKGPPSINVGSSGTVGVQIPQFLSLSLLQALGEKVNKLEKMGSGVSGSGTGGDGEGKLVGSAKSEGIRQPPPNALEIALHGRKWMVKVLLKSSSTGYAKFVGRGGADQVAAQFSELLTGQTKNLINTFVAKEDSLNSNAGWSEYEKRIRTAEVSHLTTLVVDVLNGYSDDLDEEQLNDSMSWLVPLLSTLIQSNNKPVRVLVHKLFEGPLTHLLEERGAMK